mmetsp:Transcript_19043/g.35885  ORF Transcript_19043/g.35885 Transcript_19043/m.35885 type:complete len:125 (+) Transcript_19043:73-447(+)
MSVHILKKIDVMESYYVAVILLNQIHHASPGTAGQGQYSRRGPLLIYSWGLRNENLRVFNCDFVREVYRFQSFNARLPPPPPPPPSLFTDRLTPLYLPLRSSHWDSKSTASPAWQPSRSGLSLT